MAFDRFEGDFQYIVRMSREFVSLGIQDNAMKPKCRFSLQSRILWPLYIVGTRCRDPLIRREAAELLEIYDCKEGPWAADCISRAIRAGVEVEEGGLLDVRSCSDVPRENRITPVKGIMLGSDEYMAFGNDKRDRAIRWLQVDYNRYGLAPKFRKER